MSGNYHSHMLVVYGTGFSTLSSILLIFTQLNSHPKILWWNQKLTPLWPGVGPDGEAPLEVGGGQIRGGWENQNLRVLGDVIDVMFAWFLHVMRVQGGLTSATRRGLQIIYSLATIQFASSLMVGYLKSQAPNFPLTLCWLVVWNINSIFHFIYGMSSFPLTNSYFSRLLKPPTSLAMTNSMEVRRTSQGRQKGALHDAGAAAERRIVKYGATNPTIFLIDLVITE